MDGAIPESAYYERHLRLPGFSRATQQSLKSARVLIVGVGGLGCPAAMYLAGAGVGTIGLCDADHVSVSNLHRQMLYDTSSVGRAKVEIAADRLMAMNPNIRVDRIVRHADEDALTALIGGYDIVLDGTDNFASKYLINDACARAGKPLVYGSIFQFEGQVSVFSLPTKASPKGFSYRDLFPEPPPAALAQNCGEAGVIGVLPGVVGTLQATEVIKIITGLGEPLSGTLLIYDALTASFQKLKLTHADQAAKLATAGRNLDIAYADLQRALATNPQTILIDVREPAEHANDPLGGINIPLAQLPDSLDLIPRLGTVVLYCKSGQRSSKGVLYLRRALKNVEIVSLAAGLDGMNCSVPGSNG